MNYLSVCSGIEAATQAWHPLGWRPVAFSEVDRFASAILKHHYPDVPNYGDMTKFQEWPDADIDVLCGGTPCQSFSVAGLRKGLADPRGNLMLTYGAIAARYRPRWLVWENVPGVFSSAGGRDFGSFLGLLTGRQIEPPKDGWQNSGIIPGIADAYGIAWRMLDAQYIRTRRFPFAVPQSRDRVWVVGYLGDWRRAAAVLFDRESLSGHPPPRRETGKGFATGFTCGPSGGNITDVSPTLDTGCKDGPIRNQLGVGVICANSGQTSYCLTASAQQSLDAETETLLAVAFDLRGEGFDASEDGTGRGTPIVPVVIQERAVSENIAAGPGGKGWNDEGAAYTLEARNNMQAVAFDLRGREGGAMPEGPHQTANIRAASGGSSRSYVALPWAVRRLTPNECELLQGFPYGFTKVSGATKGGWRELDETEDLETLRAEGWPLKQKQDVWFVRDADGPRYRAIGNSWAVNCAEWIGERIAEVDTWPI